MLLSRGADVNSVDFEKRTPLLLAAWQNQGDVARVLLKHGAKPGLKALDGASPLAVAVQEGHDAVVRVLLSFSKLKHCFPDRLGGLEDKQVVVGGSERGGESSGCTSCDSAADEEEETNVETCGFRVKYRKPSKFSQKQQQMKKETEAKNEKNDASDTPTTTTTTSGISSMEITFSNSVAVRAVTTDNLAGSATSGSSGIAGEAANKASSSSLLDSKAVVATEVDSSSSSGEAASGSRNSHQHTNLVVKQSSNNSLDFTRELDRLSNPRNRSYRGACYNLSTRSTSDSNRSLSSDNPAAGNKVSVSMVTRRPNKKKHEAAGIITHHRHFIISY